MDDILPWLIFQNAPHLGLSRLHKLLLNFEEDPVNVIKSDKNHLKNWGLSSDTIKYFKTAVSADFNKELSWLKKESNFILTFADPAYPEYLKQISDPPLLLYCQGKRHILLNHQIAIVGSRNPTRSARNTTLEFSADLSELGFTITSGLALGIDYCAHTGALEKTGNTIAVMGHGLDQIYPKQHQKISEKIKETGLILSEFAPGVPPLAANFPRRNRLISGLSLGVLVVEAALRSGSLITARLAAEQGREVFAIPGSIHNPLTQGCHALIKQGAKLTESVEDILDEFNIVTNTIFPERKKDLDDFQEMPIYDDNCMKVLEHISFDSVSIDKIIESSGLTADIVSSMLLILEVQGVVSSSGGLYMRTNQRKRK